MPAADLDTPVERYMDVHLARSFVGDRGAKGMFEVDSECTQHRQSRASVCTVSDTKRLSTRCLSMVKMFSGALYEMCRCDLVPRGDFVL